MFEFVDVKNWFLWYMGVGNINLKLNYYMYNYLKVI